MDSYIEVPRRYQTKAVQSLRYITNCHNLPLSNVCEPWALRTMNRENEVQRLPQTRQIFHTTYPEYRVLVTTHPLNVIDYSCIMYMIFIVTD